MFTTFLVYLACGIHAGLGKEPIFTPSRSQSPDRFVFGHIKVLPLYSVSSIESDKFAKVSESLDDMIGGRLHSPSNAICVLKVGLSFEV